MGLSWTWLKVKKPSKIDPDQKKVGRARVKRTDKCHGRLAEAKTARRLGGRTHAGSGNLGEKADFTIKQFKVENKATINASMSLKLDWLLKVSQEALEVGKTPALSFQFVKKDGEPRKNGSWVAIPEKVYQAMLDELGDEWDS